LILFLLFCLLGIWAANRATHLFKNKDPQQAVVDEVIGQLITFLFVPFVVSWHFVIAGFLLFRLFRHLEALPDRFSAKSACRNRRLRRRYSGGRVCRNLSGVNVCR
jgi:phosphatidylglycerophosphatase A